MIVALAILSGWDNSISAVPQPTNVLRSTSYPLTSVEVRLERT
jgi:hypothetical protein